VVYVVVGLLKAGLVHVRVGMLGPVAVCMGVLVLDVVVFVCGVHVGVSHSAMLVLVLVGVRDYMDMPLGHVHPLNVKHPVLLGFNDISSANELRRRPACSALFGNRHPNYLSVYADTKGPRPGFGHRLPSASLITR
jgi:hypothetical protein